MSTDDTCIIGDCKFTKINKKIKCIYCNFECCTNCCKQYLLTKSESQCMNTTCNKIWNSDFMMNNFSSSWLNGEYKDHIKGVLFSLEKSLLHTAVEEIEREKIKDECRMSIDKYFDTIKQLEKLEKEINKLEVKYKKEMNKDIDDEKTSKESVIKAEKKKENKLKKIKKILDEKIEEYDEFMNENIEFIEYVKDLRIKLNTFDDEYKLKKDKEKYDIPCPVKECRGLLNSKMQCVICNINVCISCRDIKKDNEEHVCDKNMIELVKLIKKDTKPCPSCKTMISKIDGCDQMFCIECKTAFSWKTGQVEKGRIHNPHYFEMLRKNGDNDRLRQLCEEQNQLNQQREQRCGVIENRFYDLSRLIRRITETLDKKYKYEDKEYYLDICDYIRKQIYDYQGNFEHLLYISRIQLYKEYNLSEYNLDLRVKYVKKEIGEKDMKTVLMARFKKNKFNQEISMLIKATIEVIDDINKRIFDSVSLEINKDDKYEVYKNLCRIIVMINDSFKEMGEMYKYCENCIVDISNKYNYNRELDIIKYKTN